MPDHVHLLLEIPLKLSVSYLKGKSALMMLDRHANLKYKFGKNFWPKGFYVSTVGLNIATVEKYIREQEMHDQMVDKLSVKDYGDPFSNARREKKRKRKNKRQENKVVKKVKKNPFEGKQAPLDASGYYRLIAAVQTTPFRRGFYVYTIKNESDFLIRFNNIMKILKAVTVSWEI